MRRCVPHPISLETKPESSAAQCLPAGRTVHATGPLKAQSSVDEVATPHCDTPDTIRQRTAEECGRSAARATQGGPASRVPAPPSNSFRNSSTQALTMGLAEAYITPPGVPPLSDGASVKPLTVYTVNHPAISHGPIDGPCRWPCRMCGFRRLFAPGLPVRGGSGGGRSRVGRRSRKVPGCLTSESEERETWTAESLRAAFANGRPFVSRPWKRLRRSTFQVNTMHTLGEQSLEWSKCDLVNGDDVGLHPTHRRAKRRRASVVVRNVIGREKVLIQLESLILAQSERWRQA
jgi:hypothetical protein